MQRAHGGHGTTIPTELLFNGGSGFYIGPNVQIASDPTVFQFNGALLDYLVIMDMGNEPLGNLSYDVTGYYAYFNGWYWQAALYSNWWCGCYAFVGASYDQQYYMPGGVKSDVLSEGQYYPSEFVTAIYVDGTYVPPPPPPVGGNEYCVEDGDAAIADVVEVFWSE